MKVPPRHHLTGEIEVTDVPHGYDVIVHVRTLDRKGDFRHKQDVVAFAWATLTRAMQSIGVDVHQAIDTLPGTWGRKE